jgi:hypothetical protein
LILLVYTPPRFSLSPLRGTGRSKVAIYSSSFLIDCKYTSYAYTMLVLLLLFAGKSVGIHPATKTFQVRVPLSFLFVPAIVNLPRFTLHRLFALLLTSKWLHLRYLIGLHSPPCHGYVIKLKLNMQTFLEEAPKCLLPHGRMGKFPPVIAFNLFSPLKLF